MTNTFVEIDTLTDAGHAAMHALNDAELDAVAGGLDAGSIMILRWLYQHEPSLVPAVFTRTNPAHIC